MVTRTKEQKQQVNDTHCCVCFKLRTTICISICISILMILVYGYEYWTKPHLRAEKPSKFYGYLFVAGIEFLCSIIGWIGAYNHMRSIIKYFTYWIIIHSVIIVIVFWVSSLFDYLHFGFFIAWVILQILLLLLLWKYKQILKMIYGWTDDPQQEEEDDEAPQTETEPISVTSEEPKKDPNNANVNVSINLTMPQQQQPQPQMYQQPMMGYNMQPMPMMYPPPQYPHIPNNNLNQLQRLQSNPPNAPNLSQRQILPVHAQNNLNSLVDVAQQADPPLVMDEDPNQVRIAVYSEAPAQNEEIVAAQTTDYGDDVILYEKPRKRGDTNQGQKGGGEGQKDMIIHSDTEMSAIAYQTNTNLNTQQYAYNQQQQRADTPDPPPPPPQPMQGNIMLESKEEDSELDEDYIVEVQPNVLEKQETKGVNLFFLDPGDNATAGYQQK